MKASSSSPGFLSPSYVLALVLFLVGPHPVVGQLTEDHWIALAIIPKFTGTLSLIGSLLIVLDIVRDRRKRVKVYNRIVLGMSTLDCFTSAAYFFSTWPIPVESAGPVQFAIGNTATCTVQGFFVQMSLGGPAYNLSLAVYYLLVLNYRWTESQTKRLEPYFHAFAWTVGIGTASAGLPLKLYNNSALWCWVSGLPGPCSNTRDGDNSECIRGENAWIYRWALFYAPLWAIIFSVTFLMAWIVWAVVATERKSRKFRQNELKFRELAAEAAAASGPNGASQNRVVSLASIRRSHHRKDNTSKLTRRVFWQSIRYVLCFYLTFIAPTTLRALQTAQKQIPNALYFLMALLMPMQGFFNATVYFSMVIRKYTKKNITPLFSTRTSMEALSGSIMPKTSNVLQQENFHASTTPMAVIESGDECEEEEDDDNDDDYKFEDYGGDENKGNEDENQCNVPTRPTNNEHCDENNKANEYENSIRKVSEFYESCKELEFHESSTELEFHECSTELEFHESNEYEEVQIPQDFLQAFEKAPDQSSQKVA